MGEGGQDLWSSALEQLGKVKGQGILGLERSKGIRNLLSHQIPAKLRLKGIRTLLLYQTPAKLLDVKMIWLLNAISIGQGPGVRRR